MPKSPCRLAAEKLCAKFPDTPSRTLAKRLAATHQITIESARSFVRKVRGNVGVAERKAATSPRENQPAGWKPEMPPSLAVPWLPFELGNDIKLAVISDSHIPYHDRVALAAAVTHCKKRKPNTLLINGDFADFYSISRHQKDPSKRDLENEITAVRDGLRWLRAEFGKKCRIVFKLGNHENRWRHWLWNAAPEISNSPRMDIKEWIEADKVGIEIVSDGRPVMAGKLPILHGHEMQGTGGVNPSRAAFNKTMSTLMVSHSHRTSHHTEPNLWHAQISCWSIGCLCDPNPEWNPVNKWNHGAANVEVSQTGEFAVENFRIGPSGEIWA